MFFGLGWVASLSLVFAVLVVIGALLVAAHPIFGRPELLIGGQFEPAADRFGLWPALAGTLATTSVAVLLGAPIGLGAAFYVAEMAPRALRTALSVAVDVAAGIPSVVWGLFGLVEICPFLAQHVYPRLFGAESARAMPLGLGLLSAAVLLALMLAPTVAVVGREVLAAVPNSQREGAIALGATRFETLRHVVLPYAWRGLVAAVVLGVTRALGEGLAVSMVIGGRVEWSGTLLAPGVTVSSLLVDQLGEETGVLHAAALAALALLLVLGSVALHLLATRLAGRGLATRLLGRGVRPTEAA